MKGHYCFKERGLPAQVWKKGKAQVLPLSAFQCEFCIPFPLIQIDPCLSVSHFCFVELHLTFVHLFVPIHLQYQAQSLGLSTFLFCIYLLLFNK